eukprot:1157891-Pelagomonas_calceolata.AAC.7
MTTPLWAPELHKIHVKYNQTLAELMYTEMANSDLDKYHKVLSQCLTIVPSVLRVKMRTYRSWSADAEVEMSGCLDMTSWCSSCSVIRAGGLCRAGKVFRLSVLLAADQSLCDAS